MKPKSGRSSIAGVFVGSCGVVVWLFALGRSAPADTSTASSNEPFLVAALPRSLAADEPPESVAVSTSNNAGIILRRYTVAPDGGLKQVSRIRPPQLDPPDTTHQAVYLDPAGRHAYAMTYSGT